MPKTKVRVRAIFEEGQFFVLEELFRDGFVSDCYRHGHFQTSDESAAYAEQRHSWLERSVRPTYGTNRKAEPFTFLYPAP
jgi:hypothetical protein